MNPAPDTFRAELRSHNRHAFGAAVLSLLAALLAWNLAYFFFVLILLGLVTFDRGDFGPDMPPWIPATAFALAIVLFIWGVADAFRRRFLPVTDRPIVGWHVIADFLLLPVRLTFAIWGNFHAIRRLDEESIAQAWQLLLTIHQAGQARLSTLAVLEPDPARLHRLLTTLQILGYIDLHRSERDWFYSVCSPREAELRALKP